MIQPIFDRVVVVKQPSEAKTQSGIILSQTPSEATTIGRVVAVGEGRYEHGVLIKPPVQVDDVIVFKSYAATMIKNEGQEMHIIEGKDILAKIV